MGKRKGGWKQEIIMLPLFALVVFLSFKTSPPENPSDLVDEVWGLIDRHYVDASFNQVDWAAVRTDYLGRSYGNREEAYNAIREMLEQLEDPYTRFMDPQTFNDLQEKLDGELSGVGIQLLQDQETNDISVVKLIEDAPAFDVGVRVNDVIIAIDGESTQGMDIDTAVTRIRGPVESSVRMTIRRDQQLIDFEIQRAQIEISPVHYTYNP